MNLFEFTQTIVHRTSQFSAHDWMMISACVILVTYVALLSRQGVSLR